MEIILKCSPGGVMFFTRLSRIMRLTTLFLIIGMLQLHATGNSQKISLSVKKASLEKVLTTIELQSGYSFVYKYNDVARKYITNLNLQNVDITVALDACLKEQHLQYTIEKNIIAIKKAAPVVLQPQFQVVEEIATDPISGTVVNENGEPMASVSITIKGTKRGGSTDEKGSFSLQVNKGDVLVFSFVGYEQQEVTIGSQTSLSVIMKASKVEMENVVVTALGIKRQTKSLTYSVQEVKGEELTRIRDASFVNSLTGKVAGITINASSGGVGGATRVIMRGAKSISGNNNALYVVDGVPILNSTDISSNRPAGQINDIFSAYGSSDIISLLNPDDIESVSMLTGASATALYGSQGQNGVVVITTKSGKAGKTNLSLSNSTSFFTPFVMPDFQNTYAQSEPGSYYSWGPKLPEPSTYKPRDFFQTGSNVTTSFTLTTGNDKNQTFVSGAMVSAKGIMPSNSLQRYNVSLRNTTKFLNDKLIFDANAMYVSQKDQNMIAQGLYHNPMVPIYLFPPGGNIETFKSYERYDPSRLFPVQFWPYMGGQFRMENPYWIINREPSTSNTKRLLLGGTLTYKVLDWLSITARGKLDRTDILNMQKKYASTDLLFAGYGGGFYRGNQMVQSLYGDIIANINKKVGDFTITSNIGGSRTEAQSQYIDAGGWISRGSPPNIFTTNNIVGTSGAGSGYGNSGEPVKTSFQSVFFFAGLSYKNMVFVDASYRFDWYSQLYFNEHSKLYLTYPSPGVSVILSDLFGFKSNILSFAKIRTNYSEVGNPPKVYDGGPQVYLLQNGGIDQNSPLHYPLKPERTKAWDVGANLKFLNNRVNLDVTLYKTNTYHQIFVINQSSTSGGNKTFLLNAGNINNKGVEAALGYNGRIGKLQWESNATFTLNRSKVIELYSTTGADGKIKSIDTLNFAIAGSYEQKLAIGGSMSAIYTTSRLTQDPRNQYVILNPGVSVDNTSYIYAGDADPKYTLGFNNSFTFKNFNLSFLIFARVGGVGVSATQAMMDAYGVSQVSAEARNRGYVNINGAPYADVKDYYTTMGSGLNGVLGYYVYDATNVRLREFSIGYTVPGKIFGDVVKSLKVALTGNNLFMFYNKSPFDPESTASSGTFYQGIDYFKQPSYRSVGFNVRVQF